MREWLVTASEPAIVLIDGIAMLVILYATLRAFVQVVLFGLHRHEEGHGHQRRALWLDYGRWLVAGLTFQLAADIIESSVVPTWEGIGQLGAVAVIRTFLNYFLERDINEVRERDRGGEHVAQREPE
ncbi:MAG TPA: DUF1622 domain-containing protein [Pseudoxanthomonas sp.]|jgi:uncharacterized membrane protein|nr:DUF1622 domain-containing protein [Pseudoxanthomonas sp.]